MGHDIDKIFQQKIREAEQRPVYWQKEATWQRLSITPSRSRRYIYYAAAASCLLIMVTGIYSYRHLTSKRDVSHGQSTTASITPTTPIPQEMPKEFSEKPAAQRYATASLKNAIQGNIAPVPDTTATNITDAVPTITPVVVSVDSAVSTASEPNTLAADNKKIKPIIGIIPEQTDQPVAVRQEKKRKVKLFHSEKNERSAEPSEENKLVIARIN
ncbi:hypothetical protein [Ohtaekwangia sp.]|uniref:hypothetical protein n=1 Tax=Ohtaekwangia sp. TaxID=2066019 RepID=UPI002FDE780C